MCKYIVKYTYIRFHEVALFKSLLDYVVTNMLMLNIRYSTGINRNDLTLIATYLLFYSHNYDLYNMSKVLRNPSGGKLLKLPNSVRVFPPAVTNVEKVSFAYLLV